MTKEDRKIIKEIKESITNECVSYSEIAWLHDHNNEILEYGDVELAQWAGIDEETYHERNN